MVRKQALANQNTNWTQTPVTQPHSAFKGTHLLFKLWDWYRPAKVPKNTIITLILVTPLYPAKVDELGVPYVIYINMTIKTNKRTIP